MFIPRIRSELTALAEKALRSLPVSGVRLGVSGSEVQGSSFSVQRLMSSGSGQSADRSPYMKLYIERTAEQGMSNAERLSMESLSEA
jgi:hypothetical protein